MATTLVSMLFTPGQLPLAFVKAPNISLTFSDAAQSMEARHSCWSNYSTTDQCPLPHAFSNWANSLRRRSLLHSGMGSAPNYPPLSKSYLYERWKDVQPASAAQPTPSTVPKWWSPGKSLWEQHPNKRDSEDCRVCVAQEMTPTKQYTASARDQCGSGKTAGVRRKLKFLGPRNGNTIAALMLHMLRFAAKS